MRYFEDLPYTEMAFRDVPDGALFRIVVRGRPWCWARNVPGVTSVHPNRLAQVAR